MMPYKRWHIVEYTYIRKEKNRQGQKKPLNKG